MSSVDDGAVAKHEAMEEGEMKKLLRVAGWSVSPKRGRRPAATCMCCGFAPCTCPKTCFCQELKAEMTDDDDVRFEEEPDFSFLRCGVQSV